MKTLRLWIAFVGLSGTLSCPQDTGARLQTPSAASVSAGESQRLLPGQPFIFQLRFDKAPDGYGGGEINCTFQNSQFPNGKRLAPPEVRARTDLHDGQAIYTISIPITDDLIPGIWKLTEVRLGRTVFNQVTIQGDVTFEIPRPAPVVVHIEAPGRVRAGERFVFKVNLDEFPKDLTPGCVLKAHGSLQPASPNPVNYGIAVDALQLKPDQHVYEMSGSFAPDVPSGAWQGTVNIFAQGTPPNNFRFCRTHPVKGNTQFSFIVDPAVGLVTPTTVAVIVNPSQIQLLLGEADRLKAKARHLEEQLTSENVQQTTRFFFGTVCWRPAPTSIRRRRHTSRVEWSRRLSEP
jgi:hypothetical protein